MKRIEVAVGVLFNENDEILIGQRTVKDKYYQKWEFPGGKLENGESPEAALVREFSEEVGVVIDASERFMVINHDYPDRHVRLHVQIIENYSQPVRSMEGQALQWVALNELSSIDFLQGNRAIVEALIKRQRA